MAQSMCLLPLDSHHQFLVALKQTQTQTASVFCTIIETFTVESMHATCGIKNEVAKSPKLDAWGRLE
jgi:hypothetical protein